MQVRLSREVAEQVQSLADSQRRSVSQMATLLIEDALKSRGTPPEPVSSETVELLDAVRHPDDPFGFDPGVPSTGQELRVFGAERMRHDPQPRSFRGPDPK